MLIEKTPDNLAWAAAVKARIKAEARYVTAKAALFRCAGVAVLASGIGAGAGLAWGYSSIPDNRALAAANAAVLSNALAGATLKVEGTVKMAEDSRVGVSGGVSLLQPAIVRVDTVFGVGVPTGTPVEIIERLKDQRRAGGAADQRAASCPRPAPAYKHAGERLAGR